MNSISWSTPLFIALDGTQVRSHAPHGTPWVNSMPREPFQLYDLVTRDGSDVHVVTYLTEGGFSGDFECLVAPVSGWCNVGDVEHNVCGRYSFLYDEQLARVEDLLPDWVRDMVS